MSNQVPSESIELTETWKEALQIIEPVVSQFPISHAVPSWVETMDWLLDEVSSDEAWRERQESFQFTLAERWQAISQRALSADPRKASDLALADADFNPLDKGQPWGVELTRAFRAALAELGPAIEEDFRTLPDTEHMRAFARALKTQGDRWILPVVCYRPLLPSEWQAILEKLNEIVELALAFEGAVVVWLIGGFYRDVNGRLTLHPQISLVPPPSGTRVKPLHVLLGTAYDEQCPSLVPLVRGAGGTPRLSDPLLSKTPWHRVIVQLDSTVDDYVLLNLSRLSENERELARQVMYLDQRPRGKHVLTGTVHDTRRPWSPLDAAQPTAEREAAPSTQVLLPKVVLQAASEPAPAEALVPSPLSIDLHQDAEDLRLKGMSLADTQPALAQKYLLASTVLENTSVDVWLKLVDLALNEKQRAAFRREAERALRRSQQET
jgi:hypothetical protein